MTRNKFIANLILILSLIFINASLLPAENEDASEVLNRIRFTLADSAVTDIDVENMMKHLKEMHLRPGNNVSFEQFAEEQLIMRRIVDMESAKESIIVSEERMQNEIKRRMEYSGIESEDQFRRMVTRETGVSFSTWMDNVAFELKKRQLIQIKLNVPRPDDDEVLSFYNKNQQRVGFEVRFREIILQPLGGGLAEERRISRLAQDIRYQLLKNPRRFSHLARYTKENVSPRKSLGGLYNYMPLHEVASRDQILAGLLHQLRNGEVGQTYRDSYGRYHIVRLEHKRLIPLEKVRELIRRRLYFEKEEEAFDKWIQEKRENAVIIRYDK